MQWAMQDKKTLALCFGGVPVTKEKTPACDALHAEYTTPFNVTWFKCNITASLSAYTLPC